MSSENVELKKEIRDLIESEKNNLIELCGDVIRIPSDNPPGDTSQLAAFLKNLLEEKRISVAAYEAREGNPNLVATIEGRMRGPHLILHAHMDQFPAETGDPWSVDPYSGVVRDGRIIGRGAGDMKGGLSALAFSFCLIKDMGLELPGKLTLCLVSDEETGGRWGTGWLLKNVKGLDGDACLGGEASGLTLRLGAKAGYNFRLKTVGKPAHAGFAGYAGENAIMKMVRILPVVESFNEIRGRFTEETRKLIEASSKGCEEMYDTGYPGMGEILKHVSVNIGVINGGSKRNIVPGTCEAEVDMRLPLGITYDEMEKKIEQKLLEIDPTIIFDLPQIEPDRMFLDNYTDPKEKIIETVRKNSTEVTGRAPLLSFTPAITDCRYFRKRNIPSLNYGPKGYNIAAADENVTVDDLVTVTKVYAGTIIDFFNT